MASSLDTRGGELFLEDLFNWDDADQERVDDEEARLWLQHRATASKSDVSIALRKDVHAQKAVVAVRRAVARLNSGSFAVQSLKMLGQRLAVHYGLPVAIRTSATRSANMGSLGFKLPHAFLLCRPMKDIAIVVDPAFRKQFELGRCTRQYSSFLAMCIPDVFVGTREMLTPLVAAAAAAAAASFSKLGMALPPWRCADKLLARWLPAQPHDTVCDVSSAMAAEQAALRGRSSGSSAISTAVPPTAASQQQPGNTQALDPSSTHARAVVRQTRSVGVLLHPQEVVVGFEVAPPPLTPVASSPAMTSAAGGDLPRHLSPSSRLHRELHDDAPPPPALRVAWPFQNRPTCEQGGSEQAGNAAGWCGGGGAGFGDAENRHLLPAARESAHDKTHTSHAEHATFDIHALPLAGRFTLSEGSRSLPVAGGTLLTKSSEPDLAALARTSRRPLGRRHALANSSVYNSSGRSRSHALLAALASAPLMKPTAAAAAVLPLASVCKPRMNLKLLGVENLLPRMMTVRLGA